MTENAEAVCGGDAMPPPHCVEFYAGLAWLFTTSSRRAVLRARRCPWSRPDVPCGRSALAARRWPSRSERRSPHARSPPCSPTQSPPYQMMWVGTAVNGRARSCGLHCALWRVVGGGVTREHWLDLVGVTGFEPASSALCWQMSSSTPGL